jgi:hypothetical protein
MNIDGCECLSSTFPIHWPEGQMILGQKQEFYIRPWDGISMVFLPPLSLNMTFFDDFDQETEMKSDTRNDLTSLIVHGLFLYAPAIVLIFCYWIVGCCAKIEQVEEEQEVEEDNDVPRHIVMPLTFIPSFLFSSQQRHLSTHSSFFVDQDHSCQRIKQKPFKQKMIRRI